MSKGTLLPPPSEGEGRGGGQRPHKGPRLLIDRARDLRRTAPFTERILWQQLRRKGLAGLTFRRQQPIGPYVADFYCASARLIIELDGPFHDGPAAAQRDESRSLWLRKNGYRVLRFRNEVVWERMEAVLEEIRGAAGCPAGPAPCTACPPPRPSPSKGLRHSHISVCAVMRRLIPFR